VSAKPRLMKLPNRENGRLLSLRMVAGRATGSVLLSAHLGAGFWPVLRVMVRVLKESPRRKEWLENPDGSSARRM
jgi:hypothetical protein